MDYPSENKRAWSYLAQHGYPSSQPYGPHHFSHAREILDPLGWIPWARVKKVLCLGAGGGQQVPLFASLGCRVTAVDLCPEQLERDHLMAEQYGLNVELIEGDMLDLSSLHGHEFDLAYQALSACYVPDVRRLYREVALVLRSGGYYRVEHQNPIHLQLSDPNPWDGSAYRIVRPQRLGEPVPWTIRSEDGSEPAVTCWHWIHPLNDLIGGLGDAGFVVLRLAERTRGDLSAEPGTFAHLAAHLPPFFTLFAQLGDTGTARSVAGW